MIQKQMLTIFTPSSPTLHQIWKANCQVLVTVYSVGSEAFRKFYTSKTPKTQTFNIRDEEFVFKEPKRSSINKMLFHKNV